MCSPGCSCGQELLAADPKFSKMLRCFLDGHSCESGRGMEDMQSEARKTLWSGKAGPPTPQDWLQQQCPLLEGFGVLCVLPGTLTSNTCMGFPSNTQRPTEGRWSGGVRTAQSQECRCTGDIWEHEATPEAASRWHSPTQQPCSE